MHPGDLPFQRQRTIRVEAIVLRHMDWGEADRLIWLFTKEYGKLRAVAKGVRKARSRKAGHLEPFTRVSLLLARTKDIPLITQVETLDAFLPIHDDLLRVTGGLYLLELLDRFTYEEGANLPIYRLLNDSLARLSLAIDQDLVARYYEVRLLDYLGFRPQLFTCAQCGEEIKPENQYFSAQRGGMLCPNCGPTVNGSRPISLQALKYLRHFQRSSFKDASRAELTTSLNHELEIIMQHYLTYLLERGLNTPSFMQRARRLASGKLNNLSTDEQDD
jgi:DNA repair protein RecO (recombination protein O)